MSTIREIDASRDDTGRLSGSTRQAAARRRTHRTKTCRRRRAMRRRDDETGEIRKVECRAHAQRRGKSFRRNGAREERRPPPRSVRAHAGLGKRL